MSLPDISRRRSPVPQEDWLLTPDALRPSPFPNPVLQALYSLSRVLLFPTYWSLDQLLGCWAPSVRSNSLGWFKVLAGSGVLLPLVVVGLPLALVGLALWLPLQVWRRPFCYQPPPACWVWPQPWHPPAERRRCFVFLTANLCLLPHGLAHFNNLSHSQQRAEAVGAALLDSLQSSQYGVTECSQPLPRVPGGELKATLPMGLDFVCLQEVFDLRAARRLVRVLVPNLGPVIYDVGTFGLMAGPYIKVLGSGLLLASRYPLLRATFRCFPNARREDAMASKGLLSVQVQLGIVDGRPIVGYLHCTHLHAPVEDGHIRCKQLTLLLEWVEEFEAESRQSDEAVAFSVLLGDLNFDNCSQKTAFLHRSCQGAGPQTLQLLSGPLPARRLPGTALGLRDNLEFLHATPLHCLLPRDASEGPATGKRAPPVPVRTPSWELPSSVLEGPASGLHHVPRNTRESPEPRGGPRDIQYCVCWTHGPLGYGPEASSGMLLTLVPRQRG
ncbi:sphingomyelin phosphodiesterase 5 isoform X1 [Mus caroli]|uniref:sphingomyelin phosphodiesterase n=1 Tax=Mus caroli TaxID=10089 RepID=A0A6P5R579_MUSCR|nr:sphingomyelin phosphodiesterase 5 isoform X1 [Mus caroli]